MKQLLLCSLLVAGCGPDPALDAGPPDASRPDAGPDADTTTCAADAECEDGDFCSVARCLPGDPSADARGCVATGSPCRAGEMCDEAADTCVPEICGPDPDRDGDGHDSIACGGNDCDDDDDQRYGGNTEVCDGARDEDCDDSTLAGPTDGDSDDDGFISAMCCNGAACGDDCDDTDRDVRPDAREVCNGRDDDCDGVADDEGDTPLCPGGTCVAGRCDLAGWSRTFGGPEGDAVFSVAMDELGNVYIAGGFQGAAHFGGAGPETSVSAPDGSPSPDAFVASYAADGTYRWVRAFGSPEVDVAVDVAWDAEAGQLYVTGATSGAIDFGAGVPATEAFLVTLDRAGAYRWHRAFAVSRAVFLGAPTVDGRDGPVVAISFSGTQNFGGDDVIATGDADLVVSRYAADGSHRWDYRTRGGASTTAENGRIAFLEDGRVAITGTFTGGGIDLGRGVRPNAGGGDIFALVLQPDGGLSWDYWAGGPGNDGATAMAIDRMGRTILVGSFEDTVDFGGGPRTATATSNAFLVRLDPSGVFDAGRTWGSGLTTAIDVATNASDAVFVAGSYSGSVNFGGGLSTAPDAGAGYLVRFDAMLNHRADETFTWPGYRPGDPDSSCPGCAAQIIGLVVGPADSTALVGLFDGSIELEGRAGTSAGGQDGFVVRLAN